ncbi:MAG TPA: patatin-like phospholipase family protein [Polyangiaceae bacterium]
MTSAQALTLREWLREGPFTLALSSGFFGFFAHTGVLRVLEEEDILPVRASGSSAGALVTGAWAAGVSSAQLAEELTALERAHFWDPEPGMGLLRGRLFRERLERLLPVRTFAECRIPVACSVFELATRRTRVLDAGALAPAIQASCSVPLLFHPVLHEGRWLYDGGILDRPGLAGAGPSERVFYHHLTSRIPTGLARTVLQREIPARAGLVTFVVETLPRCDPFRLEEGRRALDVAAKSLRAALDMPIVRDVVRVG